MIDQLRRARRALSERPIPSETVERILTAATWAPSCFNNQPWRFVVVTAELRRRELASAALGQGFVAQAPVVIIATLCYQAIGTGVNIDTGKLIAIAGYGGLVANPLGKLSRIMVTLSQGEAASRRIHHILQTRSEIAKVVWPSRREVGLTSVMVFFLAVLTAAFFWLVDRVIFRVIPETSTRVAALLAGVVTVWPADFHGVGLAFSVGIALAGSLVAGVLLHYPRYVNPASGEFTTPEQIELAVSELVDWMVEQDLRQWTAVSDHLTERTAEHAGRIVATYTR